MKTWNSNSPEETRTLAAEFFRSLQLPAVIALHGNLGAGKTCFTQGLALAAGVREPVCSPTYTLISEYQGEIPFHHVDLYRLGGPEEAYDLGFDEVLETAGLTVIEWPERATELLPEHTVHIRLEHGETDTQRTLSFLESFV